MSIRLAALIAWLVTASIGAYMLRTWIARGGLNRQRATGVGVPPGVVFGHASAALSGLTIWVIFVVGGWQPLAWIGVALVSTAITLGICTVTLWTPYPVLADRAPGSEEVPPASGHLRSPRAPTAPAAQAAPAAQGDPVAQGEHGDAFTITDEMIASLLAEPLFPVRRRERGHLLPLIPATHGLTAMATFLLSVLAALTPRLA
jgi:hypothetical protein